MEEGEAAQVEHALRELFNSHGFQWVLDQVDEVVLEGKPEFRRVEGLVGDAVDKSLVELTRHRGVPRSEPLRATERVSMLLDALTRIAEEPAALENAVAEFVSRDERLDDALWIDELAREEPRSARELSLQDESSRPLRSELADNVNSLRREVLE
jgi:hypothetical protein